MGATKDYEDLKQVRITIGIWATSEGGGLTDKHSVYVPKQPQHGVWKPIGPWHCHTRVLGLFVKTIREAILIWQGMSEGEGVEAARKIDALLAQLKKEID